MQLKTAVCLSPSWQLSERRAAAGPERAWPRRSGEPPAPPAGGDPKAFSRQYESQLRAAELESIQDYIAESDNLLALHAQVGLPP